MAQLLSLCSRACGPQLLSPRAGITEAGECWSPLTATAAAEAPEPEPMLCNKSSHWTKKPLLQN